MHRTIEAIVHPDGTIEALEDITSATRRRALLTILDEAPITAAAKAADDASSEVARLDAALQAAGLLVVPDDIPADLEPRSEAEVDRLGATVPAGTPLSHLISEEREERF